MLHNKGHVPDFHGNSQAWKTEKDLHPVQEDPEMRGEKQQQGALETHAPPIQGKPSCPSLEVMPYCQILIREWKLQSSH